MTINGFKLTIKWPLFMADAGRELQIIFSEPMEEY
jgi:hypothetical protein